MPLNSGKIPAIYPMPEGDLIVFYNDFAKYTIGQIKLYSDPNGEPVFTGSEFTADYRCLMYVRTHQIEGIEPTRIVPYIDNKDFTGSEIFPLYEVINPTLQNIEMSGSAFLTFWTNFSEYVTDYDKDKVIKFQQNQLDTVTTDASIYRALCGCLIEMRRYYIEDGVIGTRLGAEPADVAEADKKTYEIVPIATKPHIIQMFQSDYPITDFTIGEGGSANGLRRHDHASNDPYDGGFAFAVFHPGTGVPQKPWEAN